MRALVVAEICLPKRDGVTLDLEKLLGHLASQGHEALIVGPSYSVKSINGFPVARAIGFPTGLYPGLHFSVIPHLLWRLWSFCPDMIFVVDPFIIGTQITTFCHLFIPHAPIVMSYCTNVPHYTAVFGYGHISPVQWEILRLQHTVAALTVCRSKSSAASLRRRGWESSVSRKKNTVSLHTTNLVPEPLQVRPSDKFRVWPGGIDTDFFHPGKRNLELRQTWSRNGETILLYVGRVSWEKNLEALVRAYAALDHGKFHLVVVGDGPGNQEFRQIMDSYPVTYTGWLAGEALATAYASADIFVFPSISETFGNVVVEAMASGLPVVAFDSEGVADSVIHGQTGLLAQKGDISGFINAIEMLGESENTFSHMGEEARKRAEPWTVERSVEVCEGVLLEVPPPDMYRLTAAANNEQAFSESRKGVYKAFFTRTLDVMSIILMVLLQDFLGVVSMFWRVARHGQIRGIPTSVSYIKSQLSPARGFAR